MTMQTANTFSFSMPPTQQWGTDHRHQLGDQSHAIKEVLNFDWHASDERIHAAFNMLVQMVSGNNSIIKACYKELVGCFIAMQRNVREGDKYDLVATDKAANFAHTTIQRLLQVVPLSVSTLYQTIKECHPHRVKDAIVQWMFVKHALRVTQYCPSLLEQILGLCVDKLIVIDVEISLDDIPEEAEDEQGLQFIVEMENANRTKDDANKLDGMMTILFQYIDAMLGQGVSSPVKEENSHLVFPTTSEVPIHPDHFFSNFIRIFDKVILNTHRSKYTQFLMFYACRLSAVGTSQSYSQRFIVHLLGKLLDTTSSKFVRIAAAAYLGSYSSRASYLPINLVKDTISVFMDWALRYLNTIEPQNPTTNSPTFHNSPTNSHIKLAKQKQNGPSNSIDYTIDVELHALFYMVSQSIFYIFCFHHKELLKTANLESFAAGVQRVVESKLNPFKVCLPTVVREFSRIVTALRWFNADEVLRRNERIVLPTKTSFGGANQLESFFPFDPYLLKHSSKYITDLYSEWAEEEDMEESDEEEDTQGSFTPSDHSLSLSFQSAVGSALNTPVATPPLSARSAKKTIIGSNNNSFREEEDTMMSFTPEVEHDLRFHFSFD